MTDTLEAQARDLVQDSDWRSNTYPERLMSAVVAWTRRLLAESRAGALDEARIAMCEAADFGSAYEAVRALAHAAEAELGAPRCRPANHPDDCELGAQDRAGGGGVMAEPSAEAKCRWCGDSVAHDDVRCLREERDALEEYVREAVNALAPYLQSGGTYAFLMSPGESITRVGPTRLVEHLAEAERERDEATSMHRKTHEAMVERGTLIGLLERERNALGADLAAMRAENDDLKRRLYGA